MPCNAPRHDNGKHGTEATAYFALREDRDEPIMLSIPLRERI
jgi:hypothetical protein